MRIDTLINEALALPHGAEAAIRVWSSIDPAGVRRASSPSTNSVSTCSASRRSRSWHPKHQARLFASWALYLLVGYEQALLPRNHDDLTWIAAQLLGALDEGRFASVPDARLTPIQTDPVSTVGWRR